MKNIEPKVNDYARYSITEAATLLGIHRTSLWRYTMQGLIPCKYFRNGRKFYLGKEIIKFWKTIN